jgi:hypothetical protein
MRGARMGFTSTSTSHSLEGARVALHARERDSLASVASLTPSPERPNVAWVYGINSVPPFTFELRAALGGAQPVEQFERLTHELRAEASPQRRSSAPV